MSGWSLDPVARREALEGLARVVRPVGEANGLPNVAYTSPAFAGFERDHLLAATWTCIGAGAQVPEPGDARPVELLGLPLFLLRDRRGGLKVFHNVCSHRGAKLVEAAGRAGPSIRCPYHSWAYDHDGRLRATPHIGGPGKHSCPGFERARHGLRAVRTAVWMDLVFVDLSGEAPAFDEHIAPLAARWAFADAHLLRHGGADSRLGFDLVCNWKLAVENYCESYHLPWIHPGLNSYSRLEDHYAIELGGRASGQGTLVYNPTLSDDGAAFPRFPRWPAEWAQRAEYVALYPNVLLGIHADHFYAVILEPRAHDRTREHFEFYYVGEEATGEDYAGLRAANAETWRVVFAEDQDILERLQAGRASPAFDGGVFSPAMDPPSHAFHRWAAERLYDALGAHGGADVVDLHAGARGAG